jgi:hypothetical protein
MGAKTLYFAAMQGASLFRKFLFIVVVIGSAAFLLYLVDDDLGFGWPNTVVRNWHIF